MAIARTPATPLLHRRGARLAAVLVTALAIGAAAGTGAPDRPARGPGAGAPDVVGPAAQSGWG
jgi:hypothetical protein